MPVADRLYIEAHGDAALLADRIGHLGRVSHSGVGTAKNASALWFEVRPSRRIDAAMARERLATIGIEPCVDLIAEVLPSQGHVLARQPTFFAQDAWEAMRTPLPRLQALIPNAERFRWRFVSMPIERLAVSDGKKLNTAKVTRIVESLRANAVPLPITVVVEDGAVRVLDGHHRIAAFRVHKRSTVPTLMGEAKATTDKVLADAG